MQLESEDVGTTVLNIVLIANFCILKIFERVKERSIHWSWFQDAQRLWESEKTIHL